MLLRWNIWIINTKQFICNLIIISIKRGCEYALECQFNYKSVIKDILIFHKIYNCISKYWRNESKSLKELQQVLQ